MERVLAICEGGPLDGSVVSVELSEDGSVPPLTSRAEVSGVLYVPGAETDVDVETDAPFAWVDHVRAFRFAPGALR